MPDAYGPRMTGPFPAPQMPPRYIPRCRHCGFQGPPYIIKKTSAAGWVMFVLLLIVFFPACWVGVVYFKDSYAACAQCGIRMGY